MAKKNKPGAEDADLVGQVVGRTAGERQKLDRGGDNLVTRVICLGVILLAQVREHLAGYDREKADRGQVNAMAEELRAEGGPQLLAETRRLLGEALAAPPAPDMVAAFAKLYVQLHAEIDRMVRDLPPQDPELLRAQLADGLRQGLAELAVVAENPEAQPAAEESKGEVQPAASENPEAQPVADPTNKVESTVAEQKTNVEGAITQE
jgi:hypothetical protein